MPALVAGIHVFLRCNAVKDVDGRDKPGHDEPEGFAPIIRALGHLAGAGSARTA